MHQIERVATSLAAVDPVKVAKNTPLVDQHLALAKKEARENRGERKENLKKMRNYKWI